jgi:hypothetical protein
VLRLQRGGVAIPTPAHSQVECGDLCEKCRGLDNAREGGPLAHHHGYEADKTRLGIHVPVASHQLLTGSKRAVAVLPDGSDSCVLPRWLPALFRSLVDSSFQKP